MFSTQLTPDEIQRHLDAGIEYFVFDHRTFATTMGQNRREVYLVTFSELDTLHLGDFRVVRKWWNVDETTRKSVLSFHDICATMDKIFGILEKTNE